MYCDKTKLLKDFADKVREGKYKKMPYDTWRLLHSYTSQQWGVRMETELSVNEKCPTQIIIENESKEYKFDADDGSFGAFMYHQIATNAYEASHLTCAFSETAKSAHQATASISSLQETWDNLKMNYYDTVKSVSDYSPDIRMEVKQDSFYIDGKTITEIIEEAIDNATGVITRKENNDMDNKLFKNFDFGPCTSNNIKMSLYGLAVKNASDTWVSYDSKTDSVIDVDIINFDGAKYFYKLPVAIKDVAVGDVVIHNRKPVFVKAVEDNRIIAVDPAAGEEKAVLLTKSPFGFDFCTKVVNLFDGITGGASVDSPFGNMLPFFLLSDDKGNSDLLPLLLLSQNGGNFLDNPMALYFLAGNNKGNDLLPLLLLGKSTGYAFGTPAAAPAN